jgi:indole-3-glycerol phosphate synthase
VTDVKHSFELAKLLPENAVKISESGIKEAETVIRLKEAGYKGFLIGETFMKETVPAKKLKEFITTIAQLSNDNK